jgi:hypothetical protein
MSDDGDRSADSRSERDGSGRDEPDRGGDEEPLGDIAAEVRERTGGQRPGDRADRPQREGPLADVASEVDERRRRREESGDFESVDVGELDGEKLWEQLAEGDDGPTVTVPPEEAPAAEQDVDRDVRTIPKQTCHGCPHFGEPPELACTHEGTDILAMPDSDHFRVADCPMVDEESIDAFEIESERGDDAEAE